MTAKTKVSLRPLGVIAAGDSEEAAVRNFLRLKAKTTAIAEAAMYGIDLTGGKVGHFLVSTASIAAPFSPLSGQMSATKYKIGEGEAAASVLSQFGTQDRDALMAAFASAETAPAVFVATCSTCQHVSASDSKALLKHCTLCGDELPQEDEGDSEIDLTITDPEVEDDAAGTEGDAAAAGSEVDGDGTDPDLGAGADDENLGGETPEEVPQVSEDDTPTEADEGDAEAAAKAAAQARAAAKPTAKADDAATDPANGQATTDDSKVVPAAEDTDPKAAAGDDDTAGTGEDASGDAATDTGTDAGGDQGADGDDTVPADGDDKGGEADASTAISEDSVVTVNTLDDVVAADATPGNSATRLIYVPSATAGDAQWMALVNGVPAATVTAAQAAKANADLAQKFSEQAFASATLALCSQVGTRTALKQLGFQSYAFDLPIKSIVEAKSAAVASEYEAKAEAAVQEVAEGIQAALSASWVAHSKNFFAEDSNELKASFYDALSSAGVMNAAEVVESAFASAGEDFGRSLIARAFSLLEMPVEARNQLVSAITKANVAVPGDNGVSVASHVSERLGEMGTVVSSVQAGGDLGAAQQIRNTVQSLHRRR